MQSVTGFAGVNFNLAAGEKTIAEQADSPVVERRPAAFPVDLSQNVQTVFR